MILALLLACGGDPPASDDSQSADTSTPAPSACDSAPAVTWANFGEGFMLGYCQPCHASSAPDRHGAPATVVFDTEADVAAQVERIRARSLGDAATMPPGGGVPANELDLLEVWLDCGL